MAAISGCSKCEESVELQLRYTTTDPRFLRVCEPPVQHKRVCAFDPSIFKISLRSLSRFWLCSVSRAGDSAANCVVRCILLAAHSWFKIAGFHSRAAKSGYFELVRNYLKIRYRANLRNMPRESG